jgi:hypothetical protein
LFKALLADGEEMGKSCTYKYSKPWLGSSLLLAEGKSTASSVAPTLYSGLRSVVGFFFSETSSNI